MYIYRTRVYVVTTMRGKPRPRDEPDTCIILCTSRRLQHTLTVDNIPTCLRIACVIWWPDRFVKQASNPTAVPSPPTAENTEPCHFLYKIARSDRRL